MVGVTVHKTFRTWQIFTKLPSCRRVSSEGSTISADGRKLTVLLQDSTLVLTTVSVRGVHL